MFSFIIETMNKFASKQMKAQFPRPVVAFWGGVMKSVVAVSLRMLLFSSHISYMGKENI